MYKLLRWFWWSINDRCATDGGELEEHINGKFYCKKCGKIN